MRLMISGRVKGYITVNPGFIRLIGPLGQTLKRVIKVTPLDGHPMTIKKVEAQRGEFLHFELKPLANDPAKKGYRLVVKNTMDEPGSYNDIIFIRTDSKHKPTLKIPVYGRVFDINSQPVQRQRQRSSGTPSK